MPNYYLYCMKSLTKERRYVPQCGINYAVAYLHSSLLKNNSYSQYLKIVCAYISSFTQSAFQAIYFCRIYFLCPHLPKQSTPFIEAFLVRIQLNAKRNCCQILFGENAFVIAGRGETDAKPAYRRQAIQNI